MSEKETENKSIFPFNGYDIFGYIIPGGVFFLSIYIFDFWAKKSMNFKHNPILTLISIFKPNDVVNQWNTFDSITFIIASVLVVYVIGHIIAALSSFFIDRLLIKKGHHYPIKLILLNQRKDSDGSKSIKGNFVVFNLFFLILHIASCIYLGISYSVHTVNWIYFHFFLLFIFLIILISFIFMFSYNKILFFLNPFSRLYDCIVERFREVLGSDGGISKEVKKGYKNFLRNELKLKKNNLTTDIYWLSCIYIARKSPSANKLLINWMHLYSFSRNLSTGFFISFIYCALSIFLNSHMLNGTDYHDVFKFKILVGCLIPLFFWGISILFLLRFYYLYHGYYSKFIVRTCAYLYNNNKNSE